MMSSPHHFRRFSATSADENCPRFEYLVLPHLDAAYNLARWLIHSDCDAQNVVQEALVRAMRCIDRIPRERSRSWLLLIVRHACLSWVKDNAPADQVIYGDVGEAWEDAVAPSTGEPPVTVMRKSDKEQTNAAIAGLPVVYREVLVLRELEDLPYAEIAQIVEASVGVVVSRLTRARASIQVALEGAATLDHSRSGLPLGQNG